jgi:hypothetical protein
LTIDRVPISAATELPSSGLKSSENVTPVVGSSIRGGPALDVPPGEVAVLELPHAATARTVTPSRPIKALRFMDS